MEVIIVGEDATRKLSCIKIVLNFNSCFELGKHEKSGWQFALFLLGFFSSILLFHYLFNRRFFQVVSTISSYYELKRIKPKLSKLRKLLEESKFEGLEKEESKIDSKVTLLVFMSFRD